MAILVVFSLTTYLFDTTFVRQQIGDCTRAIGQLITGRRSHNPKRAAVDEAIYCDW